METSPCRSRVPNPTVRTKPSSRKVNSPWQTLAAFHEDCRRDGGSCELTEARVRRPVWVLERDTCGIWTVVRIVLSLALARCQRCGSRPRVLSSDILPRKLYGLSVIEHQTAAYAKGKKSLRKVAWSLAGDRTPAHTTIHGLDEGLGAHVLGREAGDVLGSRPHTALVQETEARRPQTRDVAVPDVDERRYRSEARRERLAAVAHLLLVAVLATGSSSPLALMSWRKLAFTWGLTSPLLFRSGLSSTRLEQVVGQSRARSPPK